MNKKLLITLALLCTSALTISLLAMDEVSQAITSGKNLYNILSVDSKASPEEIATSYRNLAKINHPDKGGSKEKMQEINHAYRILKDPETRQRYNRGMVTRIPTTPTRPEATSSSTQPQQHPKSSQGVSIHQLLQQGKITIEPDGLLNLMDKKINNLAGLQDIPGITNVKILNLSHNLIKDLPSGIFANLKNVEVLGLFANQITTLPAGIFDDLSNLDMLSIFDNQITTLPAGIFNRLNNLKDLRLSNNKLITLPKGIFEGLASLQELDLKNNPDLRASGIETKLYKGQELQDLLARLR